MMKRNLKVGQRLFIGLFLGCVMFGILAFYANMLQSELNKEIIVLLKEVAEQSVITVNKEVAGEFQLLKEVADRLTIGDTFEPENAHAELKKIVKRYSFIRMGIAMPDGKTYSTDDKKIVMNDKYFSEALKGKEVLSGKFKDYDGEDVMVFYMPLYEKGEVCAILFATYGVEEMQSLLAVSAFGGKGYTYVVNQNGDAVIDTVSPTGFVNFKNLFLSLKKASPSNAADTAVIKQGMENGETGHIMFNNKIDKYMYYSPLGINDWYVLNVVPTGFMDSTRNFVMHLTYLLCFALAAIFMAFILFIIKMEKQKNKELSNVLYVDSVTGGYTFARHCQEAQETLRNCETNAAYIMMDIDKFKIINELFGYEEGNRMLRFIWETWKKCSNEKEIFARRTADRFIALWFFNTREELNQRLENFMDTIQRDMPDNLNEYILKVSMGVYIIKDKNEDVQSMINYAVMAHSSIKDYEDRWCAFYDDEFKEKLLHNKIMEDQMKHALKHREFVVYYQPKYSAETKELVGAEALVRWIKADGTTVMPGKFIPLAEQNGFINYLDKYVFEEVCKTQRIWLDEGKKVVPISVNLSRKHFYNDEFMKDYQNIVIGSGLPEKYVQLELTESAVFENQEALCQIIDDLHDMGFHILVDDFGTGYSSLMMLKSIQIDTLKLDKSFVDDFDHPKGEKIIKSVIHLAQALNIEVTAEGVETQEQYEFLRQLGCNTIQGFFFARPMPEADFKILLNIC